MAEQPNESKSSKKKISSNDNDFRTTLVIWDGILLSSDDKSTDKTSTDKTSSSSSLDDVDTRKTKQEDNVKRCQWSGSIVKVRDAPDATRIGPPQRGAFDKDITSQLTFHVSGNATIINETINDVGSNKEEDKNKNNNDDDDDRTMSYYKLSLTDGDGWDDDDDDDDDDVKEAKERHHDDVHDVLVENLHWSGDFRNVRRNVIYAKGYNDTYGHFVAIGYIRPGNRLTLARRYVIDDDERRMWTIQDIRNAVLDEMNSLDNDGTNNNNNNVRIPPWQCHVMDSVYKTKNTNKKRPRSYN